MRPSYFKSETTSRISARFQHLLSHASRSKAAPRTENAIGDLDARDYAKRAAAGERFMFVSHSSIDPPNFASTTECAHYLTAALGGTPQAVQRADALGLELVEYFNRGNFNVRGYAGNDKADHCAQLGVLRDVFAALGRAWHAENAK